MLYVIDEKSDYHDKLKDADIGFLYDPNRVYFVLFGLRDQDGSIDLAIPLRANIPEVTRKEGLCLECEDTNHTKAGRVSGFDLAQAIPYSKELFDIAKKSGKRLRECDKTAKQNLPSFKQKAQKMLNDRDNGIMPTYSVNLGIAKVIKKECVANKQKQSQPKTQIQSPKQQLQQPQTTLKDPPKVNTNNNSPPPTDKTSNFKDFSKANTHDEKLEQAQKLLKNNPNMAKLIQNIPKDKVQGDAQKVDKRGNKNDDINKRY